MTHHEVEKYKKSIRVLHWVHSGAFVLLLLTGLVFFIPGLGFLAEGIWTHIIHRLGAAVFVIGPIIYIILDPKSAARGLKLAFTWGREDLGWLRASPRYYLLGDEKSMPIQGFMNTGQKLWWLMVIVFGIISVITGAAMSFARGSAPVAVLQRIVFAHDVSFIATGAMFLLHIYIGVFHPLMTESWNAMTSGKISAGYAKAHHGKWYEKITKGTTEPPSEAD